MQTYTCDDCGTTVSSETDFWFTDWKCPSEIYCLPCGPKHGFPHQPRGYWEDGWQPEEPTPQQANERDAALEWDADQRVEDDCPF